MGGFFLFSPLMLKLHLSSFLPIASVNSYVATNDSIQSKCKYLSHSVMPLVLCITQQQLFCCELINFVFFLQHLSAGLQLRLQAIQNRVNNQCLQGPASSTFPFALRKWLQCTQFKMAQVEIQSSEAASQFYPMWCPILSFCKTSNKLYQPAYLFL